MDLYKRISSGSENAINKKKGGGYFISEITKKQDLPDYRTSRGR